MSNAVAVALGVLIAGLILADHVWLDGGMALQTARRLDDVIDRTSVWR